MPIIKLGKDNRVVIPKAVRDQLGVKPGDLLQAEFERVVDVPDTDEPLGPEARAALRQAQKDVRAGRVSGPFKSADEVQSHLDSLKQSS